MWFILTLFWHSLILVHCIFLYQSVLRFHILFLCVWTCHGNPYRK